MTYVCIYASLSPDSYAAFFTLIIIGDFIENSTIAFVLKI